MRFAERTRFTVVVLALATVPCVARLTEREDDTVATRGELRALRAQLEAESERGALSAPARLGLKRALRYLDEPRDVVGDALAHGWVDDWIVAQAASAQFLVPHVAPDQRLRARLALASQSLSAAERTALADVLVELLFDPMVLGMGDAADVARLLERDDARPRSDASWRREVPANAVQQWLEVPVRVERERAGVRVWLSDGSSLVLRN